MEVATFGSWNVTDLVAGCDGFSLNMVELVTELVELVTEVAKLVFELVRLVVETGREVDTVRGGVCRVGVPC